MKYKILLLVVIAAVIYWQKVGFDSSAQTDDMSNVTDLSSKAKKAATANPTAAHHEVVTTPDELNDRRYKNDLYLKNLMLDESVLRTLSKTQELFKDTPNGEDIAVWVCLGKVLDSSPGYGEVLNYSFSKINENAALNFSHIEKVTKNLSLEDAFERGQLINLVNMMNVNKEDKIKFFGTELSRQAGFDQDGKWSADSLNLTTALIMLKNTNAKNEDVIPYMRESLKLNTNPALKNKLLTRFVSYFPGTTDELAEFK